MKKSMTVVLVGFVFGCGGNLNPATPSPVVLVSTAAPLPLPANLPRVAGVVRDSDSMRPLAGVRIEWTGLGENWGVRGAGVFTNADGLYAIGIVRIGHSGWTGTIVMRATKTGYGPQLVDVSVAQDATVNFDLARLQQ